MNANLSKKKKIAATLITVMLATTLQALFLPNAISSTAPSYSLEAIVPPLPQQPQEGDNVTIWVSVMAGNASTTYIVDINAADPANATTTASVSLITDATGYGNASVVYPTNFTVGAHTNYTGFYQISASFNQTLGTATGEFFVGLTNATQFNRFQVANIRATNYTQPSEQAWVNITIGGKTVFSKNVQAVNSVIETNWLIPGNATIGTYNVTITNSTSPGTVKAVLDSQTFDVVRTVLSAQFQTVDLNGDQLVGAVVKVTNSTGSLSAETNATGWARFQLAADIYRVEAYWQNVVVNVTKDFNVSKNVTQKLKCLVTNLTIIVKNRDQQPLPFINITLASNYTTLFSERTSFETNLVGTVNLRNLLVNASHTIEARRYDFVFNITFLKKLPEQPRVNITIIAPTYTMFVQVLDSQNTPAKDLEVAAYEWSSGISQPIQPRVTTNDDGNVTLSLTFGRYRLRLYKDDAFLNEVTVDLIQNQSSLVIHSDVYNVDLNVLVVDYFGQPIPNVFVEFQRKVNSNYQATESQTTGANGVAHFKGIIGGDSLVYVSVAGRLGETQYLYLVGPTRDVVFKMDGYVAVAGYALETSQLVSIILLLILIVAFVAASTYKRLPSLFKRRKK